MRSIWAIAANTIKQVIRLKIAAVFIVLLIVLLPAMSVSMSGDGTIKGRLQTFVSYGLSLTSLLLCLLTIVASVYTLSSDLEQRQIYTVVTKPLHRFQLILGKVLGIIILNVGLLALFSSIIYTITVYTPKYFKADDAELKKLNSEFFTARTIVEPVEVDVSKDVAATYNKLKKAGEIPVNIPRDHIISQLTMHKRRAKHSAAVGQELIWEFYNVEMLDPNQSLFIKFKYDVSVNPPDMEIFGRWSVGDHRQIAVGSQIKTPIYDLVHKKHIRTFHEIEVESDAIAKDGYLSIVFFNDPRFNNTVVIFPSDGGLEVLYAADSFGANFTRCILLILFRLIFLACLGVLASTFLSFPVAILLCLLVFFTGIISGFIVESFDSLNESVSVVYYYTIRPIVLLLPRFDKINPANFLVPGHLLSWSLLARVVVILVCIKSVLLLLLSLLIFSYKEIAKIIV